MNGYQEKNTKENVGMMNMKHINIITYVYIGADTNNAKMCPYGFDLGMRTQVSWKVTCLSNKQNNSKITKKNWVCVKMTCYQMSFFFWKYRFRCHNCQQDTPIQTPKDIMLSQATLAFVVSLTILISASLGSIQLRCPWLTMLLL